LADVLLLLLDELEAIVVPEIWPPAWEVLTKDLDCTEDEELPACDLVGGRFAEDEDAELLAACTVLA